jgi:hypothetical protein
MLINLEGGNDGAIMFQSSYGDHWPNYRKHSDHCNDDTITIQLILHARMRLYVERGEWCGHPGRQSPRDGKTNIF